MVDLAIIAEDLKEYEGRVTDKHGRHIVYKDHLGNDTVCYGRLLSRGFSDREAEYLLNNDILDSLKDLDRNVRWWRGLPELWMRAMAEMNFQLGWPRLSRFKRTLAALEAKNAQEAYHHALDSKWAIDDTPERAHKVASLFLKPAPQEGR